MGGWYFEHESSDGRRTVCAFHNQGDELTVRITTNGSRTCISLDPETARQFARSLWKALRSVEEEHGIEPEPSNPLKSLGYKGGD